MRLLVPVDHGPMVRVVATQMGVQEWTDLGSGDGRNLLTVTSGLALRRRTSIVRGPAPPILGEAGWVVVEGDIRESAALSSRGDCVSLFDVIEHFERADAETILGQLERAYRVIIVFTPRGFMRQDASTHPGTAADPLMWHRTGFTEHDFCDRGYVTAHWPIYHLHADGSHSGAVLAVRGDGLSPALVTEAWRRYYDDAVRPLDGARAIARLMRHRVIRALRPRRVDDRGA